MSRAPVHGVETEFGAAATGDHEAVAAVQRRTVRVLVLAQAVGGIGITVGISTASLLARDLSGSETLAGLVQTAQVFGAAVASYVLARVMATRGRRVGQAGALFAGALGAFAAVAAGALGSMTLLMVGALVLGCTTAANAAARYAATDLATADSRGRTLSTVMWATTIGAVLGPNLSGPSGDMAVGMGLPELTGPFLVGGVVMLIAGVLVALLMRPDPLLLSRHLAEREAAAGGAGTAGTVRVGGTSGGTWARARAAFVERPALAAAVVGQSLAHAVMVSVMIMTPLHMEHGGSHLEIIGLVISLHVLGMFAFSPLVGWAADRFGRARVLLAGVAVLLGALLLCGLSPDGHSWQITAGLFALGVGWSLCTVSCAAAVVDLAPIESRTQVQGVADMSMSLVAALAGALSGVLVQAVGYQGLSVFAAVMAVCVVGCAGVLGRGGR